MPKRAQRRNDSQGENRKALPDPRQCLLVNFLWCCKLVGIRFQQFSSKSALARARRSILLMDNSTKQLSKKVQPSFIVMVHLNKRNFSHSNHTKIVTTPTQRTEGKITEMRRHWNHFREIAAAGVRSPYSFCSNRFWLKFHSFDAPKTQYECEFWNRQQTRKC